MEYKILNPKGEMLSSKTFNSITGSVDHAKEYIENAISHDNTTWDNISEYLVGFLLDSVSFHAAVGKTARVAAISKLMEDHNDLFGLIAELRGLELTIEIKYSVVYETAGQEMRVIEVFASNAFEIHGKIPGNWRRIIARQVI